jgi:hypothetical protein
MSHFKRGNMDKSPQEKAQERIEQLKKEGKLPTLDQWLSAVAKVRQEYQSQILAAREQGPERELEEEPGEFEE